MNIPLPAAPKIVLEEGKRAVFEIEGLYPGYGQTVGNSLRRILLSSLDGSVITSVKIEGVGHEFSTIEGVAEDVVDIILNLKQLRFRLHTEEPAVINLSVKGEKEVVGKDFKTPSQVELVTPDVHVATITSKKTSLNIEAVVESGRGYVPVEARTKEKVEVGTIALDASFSPVRHVNYEVENMRVGDRTDFNRVRFHIETDGSITPQEAFKSAARILVEQFSALAEGFTEQVTKNKYDEETEEEKVRKEEVEEKTEDEPILKTKLDELKFSNRTLNALREAGIKTVGGLARKKEETLREIEGLGDKGIQEIKKALGNFGITLKQ
ncbi:MAG: DNA-directed RNA polymerase subunit alpha [Candidatus Sungiibacteriota bacterium]|uniref:DNA-directed RNA polymerase subunit alpha n=1 Tax=Candidatus Sungiibacteriota bacterium TaxID=2750080 RepID=A0A7T5RJ69_9BACT|nr:MAG: DNA-directed RNA polymerase subunit alpha [Candidatus Sungbacteria bacterium]